MRKTSVRELHIHTSKFVRDAEEGDVIVIERRGQPVAELRPISSQKGLRREAKEAIFESMKEFWAQMPYVGDSTPLISEDRDR